MDAIARRHSSPAKGDKDLGRQVSDLHSLMKGVTKLVLTRQQELRTALEKMVEVETALLHRRDFEGKLQDWGHLIGEVEEFVKRLGPFKEDEQEFELLNYEV